MFPRLAPIAVPHGLPPFGGVYAVGAVGGPVIVSKRSAGEYESSYGARLRQSRAVRCRRVRAQ